MQLDRQQIIDYYQKNPSPIVDPSIKDPLNVLSVNTYQKAGWVLNMLRHKLGDEVFWKGIRTYYEKYRNSNAMTDDFREVMESVSGKDLNAFFEQWIFTKGYPELKWKWSYKGKKLNISIVQLQKHHTYSFPLEIGVTINGNNEEDNPLQMPLSNYTQEVKNEEIEIRVLERYDGAGDDSPFGDPFGGDEEEGGINNATVVASMVLSDTYAEMEDPNTGCQWYIRWGDNDENGLLSSNDTFFIEYALLLVILD